MRKYYLPLLIGIMILSFSLAAGCSNSTVAVVNGEKITQGMVDQQVKFYIADYEFQYKAKFEKEKSKILYQQFENNAKRDLIRQTLLLQEAKRRGLKVTDAEAAKSVEVAKVMLGDSKKEHGYKNYLQTLGMNEEEFKEAMKKQILADKVEKDVTKDVTVTEAEIAEYYMEHKSEYDKLLPEIKDEVAQDALKAKKEKVFLEFGTKLQKSSKIEVK